MKIPKRLIAGVGVLVLGASALVQARPMIRVADLTVVAHKASTINVAMTIAGRRTTTVAGRLRTLVL